MKWAFLVEIIKKVLPYLAEWLLALLSKQARTNDKTGVEASGDAGDFRNLLRQALEATPAVRVVRRMAIRKAMEAVPEVAAARLAGDRTAKVADPELKAWMKASE